MPMSTLDRSCPSGADIPIEERPAKEMVNIIPQGIQVDRGNPDTVGLAEHLVKSLNLPFALSESVFCIDLKNMQA